MKSIPLILLTLGLAAGLVACGRNSNEKTAEAPASSAPTATDSMAGMSAGAAAPTAKMAKGSGTVTAIDAAAGTITLDHAPIPEAGWPAMTMGFKAAPGVVEGVKVGDKVAFDLKLDGSAGEITAISKP